jgi:hypothetical protein
MQYSGHEMALSVMKYCGNSLNDDRKTINSFFGTKEVKSRLKVVFNYFK